MSNGLSFQVLMVEVVHHAAGHGFQQREVDEHADIIKPLAPHVDLHPPVVTVQILTLAFVPAQRGSGGELFIYSDSYIQSLRFVLKTRRAVRALSICDA